MTDVSPSAQPFDRVRVRFLVAAWIGLFLYLPGFDLLATAFLADAPWYWWLLGYGIYFSVLMAIVLGVTMVYPVRLPIRDIVGPAPTATQVRSALVFGVFLFLVAWAALYIVFLPLSYRFPDFVTFWIIELPDIVYFDEGEFLFLPNVVSIVMLCVVAPLLEELAFRGVILHRLTHKFGLGAGIFWSSLLFGVLHPDVLGAFLFGVGMCVLYLRTQSLWVPILCHGVYNLAVWFIALGYDLVDGPEYVYTLQEFQNGWHYGLASGVIVVAWAWWYLRRQRPKVTWRLPAL